MNKNPRFLRSRSTGNQTVLQPIVNLWILRILIRLGAHREFVKKDHFADLSPKYSDLGDGQLPCTLEVAG